LAKGTIHQERKHSTRSLLGGGDHAGMDAWGAEVPGKKEKFPPACLLIHISLCQIFLYLFSPHPLFLVISVLNYILQASTETSLLSKTFLQPSA